MTTADSQPQTSESAENRVAEGGHLWLFVIFVLFLVAFVAGAWWVISQTQKVERVGDVTPATDGRSGQALAEVKVDRDNLASIELRT